MYGLKIVGLMNVQKISTHQIYSLNAGSVEKKKNILQKKLN